MAKNGISTLLTKQLRQVAKLELAANKNGMSYSLSYLPTRYEDNAVVDNENIDGLFQGRPWIQRMNLVPGQTVGERTQVIANGQPVVHLGEEVIVYIII